MAAPTPTERQTPAAAKLKDGFKALITFAADPNIEIWEKDVGLPGIEGGEAIEQTTQHNVEWRTFAPRQLKTLTPFTIKAGFSPLAYNSVRNLINVETTITEDLPSGHQLCYFGFLQNMSPPDPLVEGQLPMANFTIVPTNADPTTGAEQEPVLYTPAGTATAN